MRASAVVESSPSKSKSSSSATIAGRKISRITNSVSAKSAAETRRATSSQISGKVLSRINAATRMMATLRILGSSLSNKIRRSGEYMVDVDNRNPAACRAPPLNASAASDLLPCVSGCKCSNRVNSRSRKCTVHSDHKIGTHDTAPFSPTSTNLGKFVTTTQKNLKVAHVFDESLTSIPGRAALSADARNSLTLTYAS